MGASHYCSQCDGYHGPAEPGGADAALLRLGDAQLDLAHYLRWLRTWACSTLACAATLTTAVALGWIGLIWLFAVFTAAGAVITTGWWEHNGNGRRRIEVRARERQYHEQLVAGPAETPASDVSEAPEP